MLTKTCKNINAGKVRFFGADVWLDFFQVSTGLVSKDATFHRRVFQTLVDFCELGFSGNFVWDWKNIRGGTLRNQRKL